MQTAELMKGLLVNGVFGFALLKVPQCLCQMVIQYHCLVSKLSDKKILLFDLFLERQSSFKFLLRRFKRSSSISCFIFNFPELSLQLFDLCLRIFYKLS